MTDDTSSSNERIEAQLTDVGKYAHVINAGLGVILSAFLLALIGLLPARTASISEAINAILLPLIFVGIGLLLYGIGRHLHLLHLNLVRQMQQNDSNRQETDTGEPK